MNFFKKILLLAFLSLYLNLFSQKQDLMSLAKGDLINFNPLFDEKENLFGYIVIYNYGKKDEKTKKFEYVVLDKNLNPVANNEFEGDISAINYEGYINFKKNIVLSPYINPYAIKPKNFYYPRAIEIDLKTNTFKIKTYYDYENGKITENTTPKNLREALKEEKSEKKEKGFNYSSYVYEIKEGGFMVFEYDDYGSYTNNESLLRFDDHKKLTWQYKFNEKGTKKISESVKILEIDDNHIYTMLIKENKKKMEFFVQVLDTKTGNILATKPITGANDDTLKSITSFKSNIDNDKTFDDKLVIVSYYIEDKHYIQGNVRLTIDKKTFTPELKISKYLDFKNILTKINKNGVVEDGYYLKIRDLFFLNDGSVGLLFEKYKPQGQYSAPKTTDMVYVFTDSNFNVSGIQVFDKAKTKWATNSDYLFSQYLNEGKDVVFFFRDYQKDEETKTKNWILYINTLIEGKFNQEKVQISEKDNFVVIPYVGKEGYILLREYNEKEKFNKIRLERLNY